jgi:uncharacterized membrane protein YeaQ/YmgE (transglycosylase-associated protein family)
MGFTAFLGIVVVAVIVGIGVQYLLKSSLTYEWLIVALAGAFGAYFASETFVGSTIFEGIKDWGPQLDGMFIIPAIIGGILLALVADIGVRAGGPAPQAA